MYIRIREVWGQGYPLPTASPDPESAETRTMRCTTPSSTPPAQGLGHMYQNLTPREGPWMESSPIHLETPWKSC